MKGTPLSDYYWFGLCVSYLLGAQKNDPLQGEGSVLHNLETFWADLYEYGLTVTAEVATSQGLINFYNDLRAQSTAPRLTQEQAQHLRTMMETVCITLDAEIAGFEAFVVSPKRIDVTMLMENVPGLFAPGVFEHLPDTAQHDFSEAGWCIAFERPTAAAFHVWRGTLAVIGQFYCARTHQKRAKSLKAMLHDLQQQRQARKHDALYTNLQAWRTAFADPMLDANVTYDIHTAQDLWLASVAAVNRMVKILQTGE
jgi:hypothetical protein